nr:MAG TPA: hypothetical protein [Caudoviricetes sp.]
MIVVSGFPTVRPERTHYRKRRTLVRLLNRGYRRSTPPHQ